MEDWFWERERRLRTHQEKKRAWREARVEAILNRPSPADLDAKDTSPTPASDAEDNGAEEK